MEFGKVQKLKIMRIKQMGAYVGENDEDAVLLPKKEVPESAKVGDELTVFIYKDSEDRLIATTKTPLMEIGETGRCEVKDVTKIGAFLDIGLEKDVLLPFKETQGEIKQGMKVLAALYADRSNRLAATMRVYGYLKNDPPYVKDDEVTGTVYEIQDMGVFVAVDDRYFGLIPKSEIYTAYQLGDEVRARVMRVREDNKLDLSPRKKGYMQIDDDTLIIEKALESAGGRLPVSDKTDPGVIKEKFGISKNAFKRALGRLLKEGKIRLSDDAVELTYKHDNEKTS